MSELENAYCRLCAELKSPTKLVNLLSEDALREDVVEKLKKMNINIEFLVKPLPNTVCYQCITSVDKAFDLLLEIEKAQQVLEDIVLVKNIKKEEFVESDCENDLDSGELLDINIKHELEHIEDTQTRKIPNKFQEKKKKVISNVNEFVTLDCNINLDPEDLDSIKYKLEIIEDTQNLNRPNKFHKKKKKIISNVDGLPLSQMKLIWQDYSWQCAYCGTSFPTVDELKIHSIQIHGCCNPYRCSDCNRRKLKLATVIAHVKKHQTREYLKCSCYKCYKKFERIKDAKPHHNLHVDSNFYSTGCNQTFDTAEELTNHSNAYNRDLKLRKFPVIEKEMLECLNCPTCHKRFKWKGSFRAHLLTHTDRKRDHTCDECGKCFTSKASSDVHMTLHVDVRAYVCEICKARFRNQLVLTM